MKNFKLSIGSFTILIALVMLISACSKDDDTDNNTQTPPQKSIVEIATSDNNFSILVEALSKADLVTALEGDGPFTVFAPTNAAFETLFQTLGVDGINDLTAEALTPILLYHVVGSKASSSDLVTGYYETLSNSTPDSKGMVIYAEVNNGGVSINNSVNVVNADINATNGIVHVIDKVILPPTVVDIAIQNENFTTLVAAVAKAGLVDALNGEGPFTVFAPTNDAFEAAFTALGITGLDDLSADALTPILLYHVVPDNVLASEVSSGMVPTLNTQSSISINASSNGVVLNDNATVVATDIQGSNGVIHVIDNVILPN